MNQRIGIIMRSIKSKMRATANRMALVVASNGPLQRPVRFVLRHYGRQVCKLGIISEAADAIFPLADASVCTRIAPAFDTDTPRIDKGEHPAVNAYLMKDAITSAYSSHIVKGDRLLVPRERFKQRHRIPSNDAGLGYYNERHSVCAIRGSQTFEKAILLGGDGAGNWYHYVIECMSKAYLTRFLPDEFRDYPIIVPDEALHIQSFVEVLKALVPEREILTIGRGTAHVRNLIVIDEISQGPFNLYPGLWPVISDYSHHEDTLNSFATELRQSFLSGPPPGKKKKRIFIMRPDVRRGYNQDELVEIAKRFGFMPIYPESLSLHEQAKIFSEASHIVGASGAAWTNMVFAPHSFRGLTWIPSEYREFCSYSTLAHLLHHDLRYLDAKPNRKIKTTDDAYRTPYKVSPADFESAITHLCGES